MTGFLPTADQRELVEAVKDAIAQILPIGRFHDSGNDESARLAQLAELGILAITLDENAGGAGLGVVEEALLFEQLGRQLAPPAVLAAVLAVHVASARHDRAAAAAIARGELTVGLGLASAGGVILVGEPGQSTLLLDNVGAALLPTGTFASVTPLDRAAWIVPRYRADAMPDLSLVSAVTLRARLLIAAQLVGMASSARDMAVDYAKMREQFGRPIGSFQAVKHHCANMATSAMAATDLLAFAAVALADERDDAAFQIQAALAVASRAAIANAALNVQIHGGIGFSDEANPHLLVKHAHVWDTIAGGGRAVRADLLALPSPFGV